ncbi:MAG: lamin tail domain-containing protein, partial [Melioribacteraceae bacterium]|nr:lamin tail domain-containing protein [Melioribacteraceae bacterium]
MLKIITIFLYISFLSLIAAEELCGQNLIINEMMSSNTTVFIDEFGSSPDWIELFNNSTDTINLYDYYLSDDEQNLSKWRLPNIILNPKAYYLILASGRDINSVAAAWETIIDRGETWRYYLGTQEVPDQWKRVDFDDSDWNLGASGIGYGDGDDETIIDPVISLYLRKEFNISDVENVTNLMFNIDFDDGYVAYINGYEISRENLGEKGEFIPYFRAADNYKEANLYQGYNLEAINIEDYSSFLLNGKNVLSIQVHNFNITSSDLSAIPYLNIGYRSSSEQKYIAPEIEPLITRPHTNFNISNGNEAIILSNPEYIIIDSVGKLFMQSDISFGRKLNDLGTWLFFDEPTPGLENNTNGFIGNVEIPEVSIPPGFYSNSVSIDVIEMNDQVETYYSLDGSEPTQNSFPYVSPISIDKTTVLKIKSFANNFIPSPTLSSTYFINQDKELPIISLSTDPLNLWDHYEGIYVLGPNAESNFPYFNANFWQEWERPAVFEYFDTDSDQKINQDVLIKIFGGWSRGNEQKSLSLFSKNNENLQYKFFPDMNLSEFRSIVL